MSNSNSRRLVLPALLGALAAAALAGFVGAPGGNGRHASGVLDRLFRMQPAVAQEVDGPYESYREALSILKREYYNPTAKKVAAAPTKIASKSNKVAPAVKGGAVEVIDTKRSKELTYSAIRGMLYVLNDPFTSFLDPDEWLQMQQSTRGDFEGIGAVLEPFGHDVRVVRPISGSPAYRAGIKAQDVIMSVGTHDPDSGKIVKTTGTLNKDINEVIKLIKGPAGTKVTITVMRKDTPSPVSFQITRARIEPPVVSHWMEDKENKIGRIVLNEFNDKAVTQFDKAYADLEKQGMKGLIFDLRFNPGGLLNVADEIGRRFVDTNKSVVLIQDKNGQRAEYPNRSRSRRKVNIPLVVLVNESSASASEIVAGAIKDYKLGTIVGEHTFGKGLVQTLIPLTDGSALRLTTQKYFTPLGNDISNKYDEEHRPIFKTGGVKADVDVKQNEEWELKMDFEDRVNDLQLKKAIELMRQKLGQKG